jgi:hypothetical protein
MSLTLPPNRTSYHTVGRAVVAAALLSAASACGSDPPPPAPRAFSASEKARFPHDEHVTRHKLECIECHHETNAARLDAPHDPNFFASGINCKVCHQDTSKPREPQACSTCHPVAQTEVADETLSAKVVIHRTCWRCHPPGEGANASEVCGTCHGGVKPALAKQIAPPTFRRKGAK